MWRPFRDVRNEKIRLAVTVSILPLASDSLHPTQYYGEVPSKLHLRHKLMALFLQQEVLAVASLLELAFVNLYMCHLKNKVPQIIQSVQPPIATTLRTEM